MEYRKLSRTLFRELSEVYDLGIYVTKLIIQYLKRETINVGPPGETERFKWLVHPSAYIVIGFATVASRNFMRNFILPCEFPTCLVVSTHHCLLAPPSGRSNSERFVYLLTFRHHIYGTLCLNIMLCCLK